MAAHVGMEKWKGKVALVTGASSGIGEATAERLVSHGMKVVGCGRNMKALEGIAKKLNSTGPGEIWPVKCDVTSESSILDLFQEVEKKYGALHVLVNNAGLAHDAPLLTGSTHDWQSMISTNVMAVCICSREAVKLMDKCKVDDGYIINMNSTSGHAVDDRPHAHFYQVTKYAVTAMTEGLRRELIARNSHIRVTSISPGTVKTDFVNRWHPNNPDISNNVYSQYEPMTAGDIADTIVLALSSPPRVNICEMYVKATEQLN